MKAVFSEFSRTGAPGFGWEPGAGSIRASGRLMKFKVLIVEDSRASREIIAATVETIAGVKAFTTGSGFEALKLLPRHRFDLIITDINMPDINGLELINFVKKNPNYRDTPLFVITTEGREQDRARGLALGAAEYLVKPFEPQNLEVLTRQYLKIT